MLSAEEIQKTMNTQIAEMIVEKLALHLRNHLQEQWDKVVSELVSTRKSNEELKQAFNNLVKSNNHIEAFIAKLQQQNQKTSELQAKEERILDFLINEFNIKPR